MPRILAIDYGIKRTGIAITDELQIIASGLTTIPSETAIIFLTDYFAKENVSKVLIGEPKQMNGQPSESTPIIDKFITRENLSSTLDIQKVTDSLQPVASIILPPVKPNITV
jgi:putative Holliday junction resolvase